MTTLLIVMYILAGTFILIGIIGGSGMQLEKFSIPAIPRVARITALTFGTFFFAIALYFTVVTVVRDPGFGSPRLPAEKSPARTVTVEPEPDERPTTPQTRVIFNTLSNGSLVERKEKIKGTVLDIPPGKDLWIVVHSQSGSRYYPQAGPISVTPDGNFEADGFFGSPSDASRGNRFSIIVAVASKEDSDEFARYRHDGKLANKYEGLATIPDSVVRAAELTVIRR